MSPLIESIRIKNRILQNIDLHNERFNKACKALFGICDVFKLEEIIQIPNTLGNSIHKCRIVFDGKKIAVEISPYTIRKIKSLKLVNCQHIEYKYKMEDRTQLNTLFEKRAHCDDIIIVKNGYITDSWAANIILFRNNEWHTPSTPLLEGVQRQFLLNKGIITKKIIRADDLNQYTQVKLINAMVDFERAAEINIRDIF